ncbi:ISPpu15%2C transposase Orf2 [Bordetella ansorpii]|uniref:ISPpu15, transposase Orf2 n=1 Tax=Bordetella ansorpii TaxID=288768 RepID=A0A157S9C7_9BORD|nr:IS66 family transposase [Bordetella ansorpii]SAI67017.1 ISPpu15%2C transposase Orf2 [Bordetella ansorpii]
MSTASLDHLDAQQLRALAERLMGEVASRDEQLAVRDAKIAASDEQLAKYDAQIAKHDQVLHFKDTHIEQLKQELALYKRWRYGKRSEQLNPAQASLLEETMDADMAAIEEEVEALSQAISPKPTEAQAPRRMRLPPELPRTDIHHEPSSTTCHCGCGLKRIGEDVSEKLDYLPGVFSVERHIRGKWVCEQCETLTQAPVPAQVIDKGIPTAGLLAQVLVAKFADHLPLYRQEGIFARAGLALPRSTLGEWVGVCGLRLQPLVDALKVEVLGKPVLHADETPVQMLKPGAGKTHRAYLWAYTPTSFDSLRAVLYDFAPSRAGEHCRTFLEDWRGKLVTDDYAGYKAGFAAGITELGCMAHARRKFHDLHANHQSQIATQALELFGALYGVERDVADLPADERRRIRQDRAKPITETLHRWLIAQRQRVPDGSGTARAIDYSLKRWEALTRYLHDGDAPIDNNWVENQIRPWAIGRSNWLFAGSLRGGQRAAAIMSLIQSARLNGHDPYAYLKDVLTRLPTQKNHQIAELLPHRWQPAA